jgi:acyl dehydratase
MRIRYRAPARAGDTVRIELTVREKESEPGPRRGWVRLDVEVKNQRDEVVSDGEWLMLMQCARPDGRRSRRG